MRIRATAIPTASLVVEALRARPAALFWLAVLTQAAVWTLVPALLFASPPGDVAEVLAIGREWQLGSWRGPPLAFWLADLAYRAAGNSVVGVYVLAQASMAIAYWAVFALSRAMLGTPHALIAVLLMMGVAAFSLPTPAFGPNVLAVPLTALALLALWRALEGWCHGWIAMSAALGLLLLTSYWGALLVVLILVFLALTPEGRRALSGLDFWAAAAVALLIALPHAVWMAEAGQLSGLDPDAWVAPGFEVRLAFAPLMLLGIAALHAGLLAAALLAGRPPRRRGPPPPAVEGLPRTPLARDFLVFFAVMPPLMGVFIATVLGAGGGADWAAPLVTMSAPAVVMLGGEHIRVYRQRAAALAATAALLLPPLALVGVDVAAPFTPGADLQTHRPATAMGAAFTDAFRRETGRPLGVVVGDAPAYLVALGSADRPRVHAAAQPERTPWITEAEVRRHGAVAVWPLDGEKGEPPAALVARFPELRAAPPQQFPLPGGGIHPSFRLGWGLIAPHGIARSAAP